MSRDSSDTVTDDIRLLTSARIPTRHGEFQLALYENSYDEKDHLALVHGNMDSTRDVLVRIHSECFTGDVLGSLRCDCGEQLNASMRMIAEEGSGIILYLRQEGRGIGLHDKLRAYNLQDEGYDTVDANLALGHGADERDYTIGALMLHDLGIQSVRLLTNNPEKIESLETHGIEVIDRVPVQPQPNEHNTDYLQTKLERMQHMLDLQSPSSVRPASSSTKLLSSLQRHIDRQRKTSKSPFVTVMLHQRLDGALVEWKEGYTPSFVGPVAARHDAIVASPRYLDVLTSAPAHDEPDGTPRRLLVIDYGLDTPIDAYREAVGQLQLAIATTRESATRKREALKELGAELIQVEKQDRIENVASLIQEWLARHDVQAVCIHGLPDLMQLLLVQHIANYIVLQVDTQYIADDTRTTQTRSAFSISDSVHAAIDGTSVISGEIIY